MWHLETVNAVYKATRCAVCHYMSSFVISITMILINLLVILTAAIAVNGIDGVAESDRQLSFRLTWPLLRLVDMVSAILSPLCATPTPPEADLAYLKEDLIRAVTLYSAGTRQALATLLSTNCTALHDALRDPFQATICDASNFLSTMSSTFCNTPEGLCAQTVELLAGINNRVKTALDSAERLIPPRYLDFVKGISQIAFLQGQLATKTYTDDSYDALKQKISGCLTSTLTGLKCMSDDLKNSGSANLNLAIEDYIGYISEQIDKVGSATTDDVLYFRMYDIADRCSYPSNYRVL